MKRIFIDTNILIDYSKGYENILRELLSETSAHTELYINPVIVTEFFSDRNLRNQRLLAKAKEFVRLFDVFDITRETGILAGSFISIGKASFLGDALIAATCILEECMLCTRNPKDFAKIPKLKFYHPSV